MKEKVLLFHFTDEEVLARMQLALLVNKVGAKKVEKKDYCQSVGYLAGVSGKKAAEVEYDGPELEEPMMIMCMDSRRIDELLTAFRRAGVPRIAYKAMLTPTNSDWTPLELYEELKREHEAMHKAGGQSEKSDQ